MIGTLMALMVMTVTPPAAGPTTPAPATTCAASQQFEFEVDVPAVFVGDTTVTPHPTRGSRNPANLVQFVVDTNGQVVANTFLALRVTDSTLVKDAKSVLDTWKYTSAIQGLCKVPQLVQTAVSR